MRQGRSPQEACEAVCRRIVEVNGGMDNVDFNDKIVAINKDGEAGCAAILGSSQSPPTASVITADGIRVIRGTFLHDPD
jgi:hypothetical protein